MKKIVFAAAVAVAVLLTGCKQVTSNIETIKSNALEITAKALPGFNYVTWSVPVDGANVAGVYRDDGTKVNVGDYASTYYLLDTNVQDGVEYTYTVYTEEPSSVIYQFNGTDVTNISDVDTLEGYRLEGNSASASCTAINPTYIRDGKLMEALELADFEEGCNKDYVINEENIILEEKDGKITVAFPTKSYLKYTAKLYRGNGYELFGRDKATAVDTNIASASNNDAKLYSFYSNDGSYRYESAVTTAGKYFVEVEVSAQNDKAYSKSYVKSTKTIELAPLDAATETSIPVVNYIDAGKTVRVIWTPAKKADATKWAADSYKVYVKDAKDVYTEIAPAKTAKLDEEGEEVKDDDGNVVMETKLAIAAGAQKGEDVYYIDYTIPNNKVDYDFYVVLSDNGKYEKSLKTKKLWAYTELSTITGITSNATFSTVDEDAVANDAVFNITLESDALKAVKAGKIKLASVGYKVIAKNDNGTYESTGVVLDGDLTAVTTNTDDYSKYVAVLKNVAKDSKVYFQAKFTGAEYKDAYTYDTTVTASGASTIPTTGLIYFVTAKEAMSNAKDPVFNFVIEETIVDDEPLYSLYDYKIYYAAIAADGSKGAWVDAGVEMKLDPEDVKTATKYAGKKEVTLPATTAEKNEAGKVTGYSTTYAIKFVKTLKATGDSVVEYSSVTANKIAQ